MPNIGTKKQLYRATNSAAYDAALAIATALTLPAVFHLALRQTEGLIGFTIVLLGLDLSVPDHTTLSRRAESLDMVCSRPGRSAIPH